MTPAAPRDHAPPHPVPPGLRAAIRRKLLRWYDRHKRDLPWRRRPDDPYAQWVAEIMLQQTRVETAGPYYARFLRRFPDVQTLADADADEVLKHWEGLGYYRRALHLHRAARLLRDERRAIPARRAELLALPGIGAYTAAAIASIAFGERAAAVDGNVARVLSRLFGITEDVTAPAGQARLRRCADALIPRGRPGDFNQAWMDLGSLVCLPRAPKCPVCPLRAHCIAEQRGLAGVLPNRVAGRLRSVLEVTLLAGVFVHRGRMLVRHRPSGGLWSRLWEFPCVELDGGAPGAGEVRRLAREATLALTGRLRWVGTLRHRLTHRALSFHVVVATGEPQGDGPGNSSLQWVSSGGFGRLCVSTAHRRIYDLARSGIPAASQRTGTLIE